MSDRILTREQFDTFPPRVRGYIVFHFGDCPDQPNVPDEKNPYPEGSEEWQQWSAGQDEAMHESLAFEAGDKLADHTLDEYCPGCAVRLTVDNAGGYRTYCRKCVKAFPEMPKGFCGNIQGQYPNFEWVPTKGDK